MTCGPNSVNVKSSLKVYDFWPMFDQAERLEELRQFRPAVYRALPAAAEAAAARTGPR